MDLTKYVASIENFPEDGIIFRDVTPLMADKEAFKETIDRFVEWTKIWILMLILLLDQKLEVFYLDVPLHII